MENASRALVIAGVVLLSLIIIGVVMFAYRGITSLQKEKDISLSNEQVSKINEQIEKYTKKSVIYGSEVLSICNAIEDYSRKYPESEGYQKITAKIKIKADGKECFEEDEYDNIDILKAYDEAIKKRDAKGKVTNELKIALKEETFELPEEFNDIKQQVINVLKKLAGSLNIKNANEKVRITLNKQRYLSPEFKELWDKVKYKTTFSVDFDTKELIKVCVDEIKKSVNIDVIKQQYSKANLDYTKAGIVAEETDKYNEKSISTKFNLPDIITYLQNETQLTRRTIVEILKQSGKLQDFKKNPQKFLYEVCEIIQSKMRYLIVYGIKYEKLGDE